MLESLEAQITDDEQTVALQLREIKTRKELISNMRKILNVPS